MFHPAIQLSAWAVFALALQRMSLAGLAFTALPTLTLALIAAPERSWLLLRRSRWLLLSIVVMFAFATPGEPLALGLTVEGLALAGEQGLRLALMLATLAVLHQNLGNGGVLAGLHAMLTPLGRWRRLRERVVVRLLLVLDYAERGTDSRDWRRWLNPAADDEAAPNVMEIRAMSLARRDWLMLALMAGIVAAWGGL